MKRQWEKPEITILVRTKADELILADCKGGTSSPDSRVTECYGYASGPAGTICPPYCFHG